jgi:hypothetical protein
MQCDNKLSSASYDASCTVDLVSLSGSESDEETLYNSCSDLDEKTPSYSSDQPAFFQNSPPVATTKSDLNAPPSPRTHP